MDLILSELLSPMKKDCQGVVFRASVQHFRTKRRGFGFEIRLVPIKKLSCPGCEACGWQADDFDNVGNDWPITNLLEAKDGQLYTVDVCNVGRDWESGMIDSWDLKLEEFIPEAYVTASVSAPETLPSATV